MMRSAFALAWPKRLRSSECGYALPGAVVAKVRTISHDRKMVVQTFFLPKLYSARRCAADQEDRPRR